MKRVLIALALLALAGVIVWATIGGGLRGTVEDRLEEQMIARGLPRPCAELLLGRRRDVEMCLRLTLVGDTQVDGALLRQ